MILSSNKQTVVGYSVSVMTSLRTENNNPSNVDDALEILLQID